jgi:ABC-type lipoprotein release transport system permease subunit
MQNFLTTIKVGTFLGTRQLRRANIWTTLLIVFIMMLTFLNMVVISGILVGLIDGGNIANRQQYTGNVLIKKQTGDPYIENTQNILQTLKTIPGVTTYNERYSSGANFEANYLTRRDFNTERDTVGSSLLGIDVDQEDDLTNLSKYVLEGEYLDPNESGYILMGSTLLRRFSSAFGDGFGSLDGVYPGDRVKVTANGKTKEFIVKGIVKSKVGEVSFRAFITKQDFLQFVERPSLNADEIAIVTDGSISDDALKSTLVNYGFDRHGLIQTATEAIPDFLNQVKIAFSLLGNVIGFIGIVVASITIFIVIFINAVTRRKYIGILKGIGVTSGAIEFSYVLQSFVYAVIGAGLGMILIYAVFVPLLNAHPLDFPFSDGILSAPLSGTMIRFFLLLIVTLFAGYIPARMIVKKNTLDSILGR